MARAPRSVSEPPRTSSRAAATKARAAITLQYASPAVRNAHNSGQAAAPKPKRAASGAAVRGRPKKTLTPIISRISAPVVIKKAPVIARKTTTKKTPTTTRKPATGAVAKPAAALRKTAPVKKAIAAPKRASGAVNKASATGAVMKTPTPVRKTASAAVKKTPTATRTTAPSAPTQTAVTAVNHPAATASRTAEKTAVSSTPAGSRAVNKSAVTSTLNGTGAFDRLLQTIKEEPREAVGEAEEGEEDKEACAICLDDLRGRKLTVCIRPCGHEYHKMCAMQMLKAVQHRKCPLCRGPVTSMECTKNGTVENIRLPPTPPRLDFSPRIILHLHNVGDMAPGVYRLIA